MNKEFSRSEIDRLGDRLQITLTPDDLRLLDAYRLSFTGSYQVVINSVRELTGIEVSGRPAKSTSAIIDKLKRESIRFSQIQDIAGCESSSRTSPHRMRLHPPSPLAFNSIGYLIGENHPVTVIVQFTS